MKSYLILIGLTVMLVIPFCNNKEQPPTIVPEPQIPEDQTIVQESTTQEQQNNQNIEYTHQLVVDGIKIPWGMDFISENEFLVTEKSGTLYYINENEKHQISGLPEIYLRRQGGLLDVALHPDFSKNQLIYFTISYSSPNKSGGNTALYSAKLDLEARQLNQLNQLFLGKENSTSGTHFGSRIVFDKSNHLYFSIGDRGQRDLNPQDLSRDGGKIYRLNIDGTIPKDNPFVGDDEANPAIYSFGHRNPQGMVTHPETGEIWINEHGPRGGDEINIIKSGKNYGWPKVTYGKNYNGSIISHKTSLDGMEQPIHHWTPSIAPSGMEISTSDKYPNWKGHVLVGSLKFRYLERLIIENEKVIRTEKELQDIGRVRSVKQGLDGYHYVGIEGLGVVRIIPKSK
ncbi:MAG: PQQ-dependent sugar dehydrogenase [Flavobacteriaceae bacterium]|nr:PQQ-dependent sugar dehydrogenase [Flavobacteriaceae bacterium]